LSEYEIINYVKTKGEAKSKIVTFDLFDTVVKFKDVGDGTVQAVGINYHTNDPVLLILQKKHNQSYPK